MKIIKLITIVLLLPLMSFSNETLFTSSFESEILSEWGSILNTGMEKYERNAAAKHSGDYGLQMIFSAAGQKGNLVTAKTIKWEAGETYQITFWYKGVTPSDNNNTNIKLFSNDGTKIGQLAVANWNKTAWTKYALDFNCSTNDDNGYVLFSFRPTNAGSGNYLLDDFSIEKVVVEPSYFGDLKTKKVLSDTNIQWVQFGPGMSGNNKSAFWHPTDSNVLFIGPNMGNSYVSFDKGATYSTTLNEDESDYKKGPRGPVEYTCVDFSRQDPDFGMCTDERNSGIFISYNRGKKWEILPGSTFAGKYVDAIAVDPKDDNIWYAGGGRLRNLGSNLYPHSQPKGTLSHTASLNKIWKSTDKGKTWTLKNSGLEPETGIETLLVDPKGSDTVYASTSTGFYKSTDAGENWIKKTSGFDYDMLRAMDYHYNATDDVLTMFVICNPMWKSDGNTITDDKGGIFKSVDRGETWEKLPGAAFDMTQFQSNDDIKKSYYHCAAYIFDMADDAFSAAYPQLPSKITMRWNTIEIDPNDVNNLYANNEYSNASRNNFKPGQVWRSTDGGQSWHVTLRNGKAWKAGSNDYAFWTGRGNPMGTNIHLRYLDEWVDRDMYERKGCNFVKFNKTGTVLHTQMAKISLFSYDKGLTWVDIDDEYASADKSSLVGAGNSNVPGHGFFQHPDIKNKVFCMAGENQLCITSDDGDNVREGAQACIPVRLSSSETSLSWYAVHPKDTMIHYGLFFRQAWKGKLVRSTDNGKTWAVHGTAVPSWETNAHSGDQSVHQLNLIIDPVNPDNMYFVVPKSSRNMEYVGNSVTGFGVHKSSDGGKTWKESNTGLPESRDATTICFDPENPNTLYVAIQNTEGGLFKSTDKGENWEEVSSTMSISKSQGINDIHFARDNKIYITAGTKNGGIDDGGAWVSSDKLKTWTQIFDYPWTFRIETAYYNPNTILISTLANTKVDGRNAGVYHSLDGGDTWTKINKGNGQSDRVNDIAIDNHVPGKYYASTYGSGWYTATDPMPNAPVALENISTVQDTITIPAGTDTVITVVLTPSYAYNQTILWHSNNESIATVGPHGKVRGLQKGSTQITLTSEEGSFTHAVIINVESGLGDATVKNNPIELFPNPGSHLVYVKGVSNKVPYKITTLQGALIRKGILNGSQSIDVFNLAAGTYVLNLKDQQYCSKRFTIAR